MIEYAVQDGWSSAIPFIGLLSLAGFGAAESGGNCGVIGVIAIASAFMSVMPELAGASMSQPAVFSHAKAGHKCSKSYHSFWLSLAKVLGEPFVTDAMLKGH